MYRPLFFKPLLKERGFQTMRRARCKLQLPHSAKGPARFRTGPFPDVGSDQFSASSVIAWVQAPSGSFVIAGFSSLTAESSVLTVCA